MRNTNRPPRNITKTRIHPIFGFLSCWALGAMLALSTQTSVRAAGPLVTSVTPILTLEHVRVAFSESVDPASATNLANYSFTAGSVTLNRATLISTNVVELFTSDQTPGSTNTLQIGGVLDLSSVSMTTTQLDFTTPALTVSPLRYDAGTTTTQPAGPSSPASALGGYWVAATIAAGQTVGPVTNDNSTGLNAWNINDNATAAGTPNYTMNIDTNSGNFGATNGWRIVQCSRVVTNYANTLTDYWLLYCQKTNRFGIAWGVNAATNLYMAVQGGSTYILTNANWSSYHTNMMVYNPTNKLASIYFDGQLVVDNYAGQGQPGVGSYLIFGNAQGAAAGSMNYNLVQLDVVGATQPVVLLNPASITNAVGQQATFTAAFTPFVNSYQWLSNGVVIAGATTTNYTTGLLTGGASGAQYICRALSALGNVQTTPATLTVTDTGPLVTSVTPILTLEHVRVAFSTAVDPASATNLANYSFTAGPVTLNRATLISNSVVELFTSDQTPGSAHTLQISGIFANGGATMMTTTNFSFTTPNLTISPLRYDAGTTVTQTNGPSSPASALGGYWVAAATGAGQAVGPVANDNSTGLNAWNIDDNNVVNGGPNPNYTMNIDPNSNAGATNGWRIVQCSRVVTNYANNLTDYWILYDLKTVRFGIAWGVNAATNLYMTAVGGSTYTLTSDAFSYHTNMMVYNPTTKLASIYFDGRLIVDNYAGSAVAGNYLIFGNGQTAAKGSMNYNLVQLDVVGATQPVVLLNPASTTIGVGQKATFTAAFTPFVNSYQWLSNGVVIAGATTTNYTTGFVTASANGAQYSLRALSALGNVETTAAVLVATNQSPVANIVTNNVTSGETWKIAISVLKTAAGWSDPDGDTVTFNSVNSPSANGTNVTSDSSYIYYNGPVTSEDHFTYTITDGTLTGTGTVYLKAVAATAASIQNPTLDGSGHPTFSGNGISGYTYGVESAPSITGPWIEAGTVTSDSNGKWSFTDTNRTNPSTIFYRLYYPDNPSNPPQ
jgi:hypothetical protein